MKIFIICSVRKADEQYKKEMGYYIKSLERKGHEVHCPIFDTDQDASGYDICLENKTAIQRADEVHIFYNSKSQGIHFDMGMAFAYGKKIFVIENEPYGKGKSFPRMLNQWAGRV